MFIRWQSNFQQSDDDMRLEFEAISRFSPEEKQTIKAVIKGLILKHEADKWPS